MKRVMSLLLVAGFAFAACNSTNPSASPASGTSSTTDSTSSGGSAQASCNYPGDLTKGKKLTVYVEGLADLSSGFFRVLHNGAQKAGKDLCVDVKYVYPASEIGRAS